MRTSAVTDARSEILASVRRSLALGVYLPEPAATPKPDLSDWAADRPGTRAAQFQSELERLGGRVWVEPATAAAGRVRALVKERGGTQLAAWGGEHLPVPGLLEHLRRQGIAGADPHIPRAEPERSQRLAEVERLSIGLTGADAALADTGTLVLRSGPGRPRLASLSVTTHIAVLTIDRVHASLGAWLRLEPQAAQWMRMASNVTLISGPSRTADIEMTLTVGVHGPRELLVVLVK